MAEWVKTKKPVSCPYGKREPEKFGFDITKADKIFDLLLAEGQLRLQPHHKIPSAEELKKMNYCKWHNATSHDTNDCKGFRQQIQIAIEQGRLKFEVLTKPMKIDQNPFATNMVNASGKNALQTKVLTSDSAKKSGAVDARAQVSADDLKGKGQQEEIAKPKASVKRVTWADETESSLRPQRRVSSEMLLNKCRGNEKGATAMKGSATKKIGGVRSSFIAGKKV